MKENLNREYLPLEEVIRKYPITEKWFADPSHTKAQILDNKRLLSVEEKIASLGGVEKIKIDFAKDFKSNRDQALILLACRQDPMIGNEISKFAFKFGKDFTAVTLYDNIDKLIEMEMLTRISGIIYISREKDTFCVTPDRIAYRTIFMGFQAKVPKETVGKIFKNPRLQGV